MTMTCIAIQSSPNLNGLTSSLAQAALNGAEVAGDATELIHLNHLDIKSCIACNDGWGECRTKGTCILEDDFDTLVTKLIAADTVVFATPVYWHDISESGKRFLDRLRRCETFRGFTTFSGKKVIGITSAGGSGRGAARALYNLEDYFRRLGFEIFDLILVTRFSKDHKLNMLHEAGRRLVLTRRNDN
jgi:multimeric flavodoxin WrbA